MTDPRLGTGRWQRLRAQVLARDGYECQLAMPGRCLGRATSVDHLVPRSMGGDDGLDNLVAACRPCNSAKGDGRRAASGLVGPFSARRPTPAAVSSSLPPRASVGTTSTVHYRPGA